MIRMRTYVHHVHLCARRSDATRMRQARTARRLPNRRARAPLHPIPITRFGSFRTQPLEILSTDSVRISWKRNPTLGRNLGQRRCPRPRRPRTAEGAVPFIGENNLGKMRNYLFTTYIFMRNGKIGERIWDLFYNIHLYEKLARLAERLGWLKVP